MSQQESKPSAVCLLSGGLDSALAVRLMLKQGVPVRAINFVSAFCQCTSGQRGCSAARRAVEGLGVDLRTVSLGEAYLEIVRHPRHGYGRNLNPCLDCRIMMFRRAADYMRQVGASFIVTGEVVGERPMSQRRHAMHLIEREAGLEGLIVRPLCARLPKPSIPEQHGWVDREALLAIHGRSRKPQMQLAKDVGLTDYPCPAGGCLLTDPAFARRLRDLMQHRPDFRLNDANLLKVGRHFRLSPGAKAVVGRNEGENAALVALRRPGDLLLEALAVMGPTTLVRGEVGDEGLALAAGLTARYGDGRHLPLVTVTCRSRDGTPVRRLSVPAVDDETCAAFRIG